MDCLAGAGWPSQGWVLCCQWFCLITIVFQLFTTLHNLIEQLNMCMMLCSICVWVSCGCLVCKDSDYVLCMPDLGVMVTVTSAFPISTPGGQSYIYRVTT